MASPVWLPPDSTPPRELLKRRKERKAGEPEFEVNYHETGPSYASAYGLVAAYHREYLQRADGTIALGRDEGIRTHGSVDYMSIMRRHSHGCHRLHNHIAVRLMSFVLAHRPHKRLGQEPLVWKKLLEYEEEQYMMEIRQGGYVFELNAPLRINVAEGRIRGQVKKALEFPIPKWDELYGAYVTPEGGAVQMRGDHLVEVPLPQPDGGIPDVLEGMLPAHATPCSDAAAPPRRTRSRGRPRPWSSSPNRLAVPVPKPAPRDNRARCRPIARHVCKASPASRARSGCCRPSRAGRARCWTRYRTPRTSSASAGRCRRSPPRSRSSAPAMPTRRASRSPERSVRSWRPPAAS